ncbi:hypothetical protein EK904_007458 [Melospiza melodia maxima]|nr:hypothetical protein EK904_007458 [Melospiza melodia maxima]
MDITDFRGLGPVRTSKNGKYWILVSSKKSQRNWLRPKSEDFSGQTSEAAIDITSDSPFCMASYPATPQLVAPSVPSHPPQCYQLTPILMSLDIPNAYAALPGPP